MALDSLTIATQGLLSGNSYLIAVQGFGAVSPPVPPIPPTPPQPTGMGGGGGFVRSGSLRKRRRHDIPTQTARAVEIVAHSRKLIEIAPIEIVQPAPFDIQRGLSVLEVLVAPVPQPAAVEIQAFDGIARVPAALPPPVIPEPAPQFVVIPLSAHADMFQSKILRVTTEAIANALRDAAEQEDEELIILYLN